MTMLLNQTQTPGLTQDLAERLGVVPDSVLTLIKEVLKLNGRLNVTLSSHDVQLLDVAQRELQMYGVTVSYEVSQAEKDELASGISRHQAETILNRRSRVVTVEIRKPASIRTRPADLAR